MNPKTLGLGEGSLFFDGYKWNFIPVNSGGNYGIKHPLDSCINIEGQHKVNFSRKWLRCFGKEELYKILKVGQCLECHKDYNDKVFIEWEQYRDYDCRMIKQKKGD